MRFYFAKIFDFGYQNYQQLVKIHVRKIQSKTAMTVTRRLFTSDRHQG